MSGPRPPDELLACYALGLEAGRLEVDYFPLERARTQELILRQLPPPPEPTRASRARASPTRGRCLSPTKAPTRCCCSGRSTT